MKKGSWIWIILLIFVLLAGCAAIPVREVVKVNLSLPVGKVEGSQFTGRRYPFKITAPPVWRIATEYPKFMVKLGYEKEGLEESELFVFNPDSQSNLQIDFTPADRYSTFDQKTIESLTTAATGSLEEELQKEYGRDIQIEIGPTEPYSLKGVPFAAKKYVTYTWKAVKREQGWIYAFVEPYQIFILYMILEKDETNDRQDIKAILNSFEVLSQESK